MRGFYLEQDVDLALRLDMIEAMALAGHLSDEGLGYLPAGKSKQVILHRLKKAGFVRKQRERHGRSTALRYCLNLPALLLLMLWAEDGVRCDGARLGATKRATLRMNLLSLSLREPALIRELEELVQLGAIRSIQSP